MYDFSHEETHRKHPVCHYVMRYFKAALIRLRQQSQGKQNTDSAFLQLPVEIVMVILGELPKASQLVLSQTCRSLRVTHQLYSLAHPERSLPTKNEKLEYLACLARALPGKWVCSVCVKLHRVSEADVPKHPWKATSCTRLDWFGLYKQYDHYGFRFYTVGHRHVQLALKYTRMSSDAKRYRGYLQKLLAPYTNDSFFSSNEYKSRKNKYQTVPKITNGRFLLKSVWRYADVESGSSPLARVGFLDVCNHECYWRTRDYRGQNRAYFRPSESLLEADPNRLYYIEVGESAHKYITSIEAMDWTDLIIPRGHSNPYMTLKRAIEWASVWEGEIIFGSCHSCLTDYSVELNSSKGVKVCAWKDLGPECSPVDPAWKTNVVGESSSGGERPPDYPPGCIRKLYEGL